MRPEKGREMRPEKGRGRLLGRIRYTLLSELLIFVDINDPEYVKKILIRKSK